MERELRYLIPGTATALSLLLGLGAILCAPLGARDLAGWMIVWCVLLDVVDGALARWLRATSRFGAELDSLADLVAFGVAPAVLAFSVSYPDPGAGEPALPAWLLGLSVGSYTLAAALRLARFNSRPEGSPKDRFLGLPTTLAGLIVATSVLLLEGGSAPSFISGPMLLVLLLFGLAVAMVSHLPVPSIRPRRNRWINALQWANVLAVYACGILRTAPGYILAFAVIYVLVGVAAARRAPR